jgi:hypothetical protein
LNTRKVKFSAAVFGVVSLIIIVVFFYTNSYAESIFNSWNLTDESVFEYDEDFLEFDGSGVFFKSQSYQSDINTVALFHLDETIGLSVHDSSSSNNDGVLSNTTFVSGRLNAAIGFNGVSSKITVADSPSLSMASSNTLEGWVKFDENFYAGSAENYQAIFDKGDYQLYFDNETGKLTYELANVSSNSWTQVGGGNINQSWSSTGLSSVRVMQVSGDYLYAGLGDATGSAQVWQFDGSRWTMIGGGQSINGSWQPNTYEAVMSMASFNGQLYVGLGLTAEDGEVWKYDGSTWTKIGGDGLNSSWGPRTGHYEEVSSMVSDDDYLYVGLGRNSTNGEVWRYDGTIWQKIGGGSINGGWLNDIENIYSLSFYNGNLVAGLGRSVGDGEIWMWNGSTWTKIGGDGVSGSWGVSTYRSVESMINYDDMLYVGMGQVSGDATLWSYDGSTWTKIGGDGVNDSWAGGIYERVKTLAVYNGAIYAGLGSTGSKGEVWQYKDGVWIMIGGKGINSGWSSLIEEVRTLATYKGKLYAGTGITVNLDANVWAWGNNGFLQSNTNEFDTNWRHIAATYDGATMKIYIDGVLDASTAKTIVIPDGSLDLIIGSSYSGLEYGKAPGRFKGILDELRISNVARTDFIIHPYPVQKQTITSSIAAFTSGIQYYKSFSAIENLDGGLINYRLSNDNGVNWNYWNGIAWVESDSLNKANTANDININIESFPITFYGIKWQAVLGGDGSQKVGLNSVTIEAEADNIDPILNADNIVAQKNLGGSTLAENDWTNGSSPYFSWDAGSDVGAGILGYCVYIGQDDTANPVSTKGMLGNSPIYGGDHCQFITGNNNLDLSVAGTLASPLVTSNLSYYLIVRAIDRAGNIYPTSEIFSFKFDNTPPLNPSYITSPSGFISTKEATFTWPTNGDSAASDDASGVAGLQYSINGSIWYGALHNGLGDISDLLINDGSYKTVETPDFANLIEGTNVIRFRTWDQAGNISKNTVLATLKINTNSAPSEPNDLIVNPISSDNNAFSFSWLAPSEFVGEEGELDYCYTINSLPSVSSCNYTGEGITSLLAGPYATQPGKNTFYVIAKDNTGNVNYDSYAYVNFFTTTTAPSMVRNIDAIDLSVKSTSNWRLAVAWDEPTDVGAGVSSYKVYRSTDGESYTLAGSSSSTTYVDSSLAQMTYYYKVTACDNTNNCSAYSQTVLMMPTGKFTEPAILIEDPKESNITTKRARIEWITDRTSDSKVLIGTSSGVYSPSALGNSNQVVVHQVELDNLSAGTTYYYKVNWTDEDGNTGESSEYTFTTSPAPVVKEVETSRVGLSTAVVQFTSVNANKIDLYYGETEFFGEVQSINTSYEEATYSIELSGLKDGARYFYQISAYDSEGVRYNGNVFSFTTLPRPRISNLQFQPLEGEPTSTQNVTWTTNVPSSSTLFYGRVGTNGTEIQTSKLVTEHAMTISNLEDDSRYFLVAQSRDVDGNLAVSDQQLFRTALDTRPPKISNINIETSIRGTGSEALGQIIVSWTTDELATSQVGYADGSSATVFNNRTSEDTQMTTEHIVVISNLPTSKVYSIQPISYDKARNIGYGEIQSSIVGRANESVLTVILNALQKVFGL